MNTNSNEIQQHVIKKQNMLPIIITSTTHVRSFVGLSCAKASLETRGSRAFNDKNRT